MEPDSTPRSCSDSGMTEFGELRFKIVRIETLGRLSNLIVARAAFDVSVSLWPSSWIELRQDARIIEKHGARE